MNNKKIAQTNETLRVFYDHTFYHLTSKWVETYLSITVDSTLLDHNTKLRILRFLENRIKLNPALKDVQVIRGAFINKMGVLFQQPPNMTQWRALKDAFEAKGDRARKTNIAQKSGTFFVKRQKPIEKPIEKEDRSIFSWIGRSFAVKPR